MSNDTTGLFELPDKKNVTFNKKMCFFLENFDTVKNSKITKYF